MEKLKAKHDHKLTDILKVAIFGLMLILPGLILLPSMLYYGVNEHAAAPTEQVEKIEYERVDFNQYVDNNPIHEQVSGLSIDKEINDYNITVDGLTTDSNGYTLLNLEDKIDSSQQVYIRFENYLNNGTSNLTIYTSSLYNQAFVLSNTNPSNIITTLAPLRLVIAWSANDIIDYSFTLNIYNLTQMFGNGNEPTLQEFNTWYPNEYYEYTESRYEILEIPTGTYETYTDITSQIQFNWNSLWQQPLFSWTNYTILKQGLDNFTYVFGITQTSYINNLIVYELIMVAIYIVIDIVITMFKWLTHLIGEK